MAIQLAAAIAPVVKKVGIEIATEVAYKMLHEETRRRKAKIKQLRENGGLGTSMDAPKPDMKQRVKNFRSEERRVGKECRSRWSPYH